MKRVFASMDPLLVEQVRSVLENAGIACHIANRDLRSLAGAIPFSECWPEVWVVEDSQAEAAERLIAQLTEPHPSVEGLWRCERCGEALSSRFTSCWKCAGGAEVHADRRRDREARLRLRSYPRVLFWIALVLMGVVALVMLRSASAFESPVEAPCRENPALVGPCFTIHGRVSAGNGTPGIRLWPVGTKRILGVSNEGENLPQCVSAHLSSDSVVFGDFLVCPLTVEGPGVMRLACIEAASRLVIERRGMEVFLPPVRSCGLND